jgi:hypothetical protein
MENSRSRLGSHRRARCSVRPSIWAQAMSSQASATMAHQILFWFSSCKGRQVGQAGVLRGADSVLGAGPAAVAQFQVGDLTAGPARWGVGGERGQPMPRCAVC